VGRGARALRRRGPLVGSDHWPIVVDLIVPSTNSASQS
jgi:hypothetical protein